MLQGEPGLDGGRCLRPRLLTRRHGTARPPSIDRFVSTTRARATVRRGRLGISSGRSGVLHLLCPRERPAEGRARRPDRRGRGNPPSPNRSCSPRTRALQTGVLRRGGWNTSFPRRSGRNVTVSAGRKEGAVLTSAGIDAHQAQDASRPSNVPAGTAGVSGCPVHQAPEQGRGPRGTESGSDGPPRSRIKGSTSEERWRGSFLEVTRCEQPAFASGGARKASARSVMTAPAGEKARCQGGHDLVIRRVLWNGSPAASEGGNLPGR